MVAFFLHILSLHYNPYPLFQDRICVGLNCRSLIIFNLPEDKIDSFLSFARSNSAFKRLSIATGQRRFYLEIVGKDCNEVREYARKTLPKYGVYDVIFEVIFDTPI